MSVAHVLRVHDQAPLLLLGAILRDGLREGPLAALALLEPPPELAHPLPDPHPLRFCRFPPRTAPEPANRSGEFVRPEAPLPVQSRPPVWPAPGLSRLRPARARGPRAREP